MPCLVPNYQSEVLLTSHPLHLTPHTPRPPPNSTYATPTAEDYVVLCPISELQASIYQSVIECGDVQLIVHSGEACDCFSGNDRGECCYVVRE